MGGTSMEQFLGTKAGMVCRNIYFKKYLLSSLVFASFTYDTSQAREIFRSAVIAFRCELKGLRPIATEYKELTLNKTYRGLSAIDSQLSNITFQGQLELISIAKKVAQQRYLIPFSFDYRGSSIFIRVEPEAKQELTEGQSLFLHMACQVLANALERNCRFISSQASLRVDKIKTKSQEKLALLNLLLRDHLEKEFKEVGNGLEFFSSFSYLTPIQLSTRPRATHTIMALQEMLLGMIFKDQAGNTVSLFLQVQGEIERKQEQVTHSLKAKLLEDKTYEPIFLLH